MQPNNPNNRNNTNSDANNANKENSSNSGLRRDQLIQNNAQAPGTPRNQPRTPLSRVQSINTINNSNER
jgi:hypothetical protein